MIKELNKLKSINQLSSILKANAMRKNFTKLFSLAFLLFVMGFVTELRAQCDPIPLTVEDVELVTDITTVCDSGLVQYKVTGFPSGTEYSFNGVGDTTAAGFDTDSTFWTIEGVGFVVQVRQDTCYSNVLTFPGEDLIEPIYVDTLLLTQPLCADDQGELTVVVGGSEDFLVNYVDSVTWNLAGNGPTGDYEWREGTQYLALPGMKYYVRVKSANDCTSLGWDSVTVNNAPSALVIADVNTNIDTLACSGDTATITVVGIDGGTAPYYVTLSDGQMDTLAAAGDATFKVVETTTYTATVVDRFGCDIDSDSSAVVTGPEAIDFEISLDDVSCADSATGAIYVHDITGGIIGSTYMATLVGTDTTMVDVAAVNDTITFDGLEAGYYSVWVKHDACTDSTAYDNPNGTGNVISVQSPDEIKLVVAVDTTTCLGESTVITASATQGSGTYEFQLDSAGVLLGWGTTKTWDVPDATADYVVWVRDAGSGSCEFAWPTISLTKVDEVEIARMTVSPTCPGGNDGVINIELVNAPVGATIEYSIDSVAWYTNNIFAVPADTFTVYARDAACTANIDWLTAIVTPLDSNLIEIDDMEDSIYCYGADDAWVEIDVDSWADQTGSDSRVVSIYMTDDMAEVYVSGDSTTNGYYDDLGPGTYYFWAMDNIGCKSANVITVEVTEAAELDITGAVTDEASCYGNNDGVMTIKRSGGTEPIEYGHANTMQAAMNLPAAAFTPWPTGADSVNIQVGMGTYYVVVKDDCGNKAYDGPFNVAGLEMVTIADTALSVEDIVCYGDTTGVIVVAAAEGGSEDFTYTLQMLDGSDWEDVTGYVDVTETTFEDLGAGTYKVVVTDADGCDGAETGEIVVDGPAEAVSFDADFSDITCNGASDGTIEISAKGGTGPYMFKVGTTAWRAFPEGSDEKTIVITEPGDYTVWVKDSLGCTTDGQDFTIDEPAVVVVTVDSVHNETTACSDDGAVWFTVTGGNDGVHFDVELISATDTVLVGNHIDSAYHEVAYDLEAGDYVLKAIEIHGNECVGMAEFTVTSPDTITAVAAVTDDVLCKGDSTGTITVSEIAGGSEEYSIYLFDSEGDDITMYTQNSKDSTLFEGLPAGKYVAVVADNNEVDCYLTLDTLEVTEPETELSVKATKISDITCVEDGQFKVVASGGVGEYKYFAALSEWPDLILVPDPDSAVWQSDTLFSVDEPGAYIVWAMDENGCIIGGEVDEDNKPVNEWRVRIDEPSVVVTFDMDNDTAVACNGDMTGEIIVTDVVVTKDGSVVDDPTYTVTIDTVANDTLSNLGAGTYVVVVTDESGCFATDTVVVTEPEVLEAVLEKGDGEFTCPDAVEGYIEVIVTGGTGETMPAMTAEKSAAVGAPATYMFQLWQDGVLKTDYQYDNSFLVRIGHDYVVVVKDANGCTDTTDVLVLDPVVPAVIEEIKDVTCTDDTLASVKVTVSGEAGRMFQIHWNQFEGDSPADSDTSEWFTGSIVLDQRFMFDNENVDDIHYEFWVVDDMDCTTGEKDTMTFDQIITSPLELVVTEGETGACATEVTVSVGGGVGPYVITVNGEEVEAGALMLGGGTHLVEATDAHECMVSEEITLEYGTSMDTTFQIYTGDSVEFAYEPAGLDTVLFGGTHTFYYDVDTACVAELKVIVEERDRMAPVVDTLTPMDTITDNKPTFVITFEDDVTFNESGFITVTAAGATEPTLEIEITEDMINGNVVTVDYNGSLEGHLDTLTTYVVKIDSGVFMGDGLVWDGIADDTTWTFTTGAEDVTTDNDIWEVPAVEFTVYPNPFNDHIRIKNADQLTRVVVSNIAGQRVLDIEYPNSEIRTGNLVSGVYIVSMFTEDGLAKSERMIKR